MARSRKSKSSVYGLIMILVIAVITIFGDKINADNINNLAEKVMENSTENTIENMVQEGSFTNGEDIIIYYLDVGQADSILIQSD